MRRTRFSVCDDCHRPCEVPVTGQETGVEWITCPECQAEQNGAEDREDALDAARAAADPA